MSIISLHQCAAADPAYGSVCAFAADEYERRYGITLEQFPDLFVHAHAAGELVGCFGASWGGRHATLTTEWYVPPEQLMMLLGGQATAGTREGLTEIGTRVVNLPATTKTNSVRLSVAMAAALLLFLAGQGGRHSLFTADRSVQVIAKQLDVALLRFGTPDLSRRSSAYRQRWAPYFSVPRECFGIDLLQAGPGCRRACRQLSLAGFAFDPALLTSEHAPLEQEAAA